MLDHGGSHLIFNLSSTLNFLFCYIDFLNMCMCVCIFMCVGAMYICRCAYVWRPKDHLGCHSSGTIYLLFFYESVSLIGLELSKYAVLAGHLFPPP